MGWRLFFPSCEGSVLLEVIETRRATIWLIVFVAVVCVLRFIFFYVRFSEAPDLLIAADSMDYIEPATALHDSFSYLNGIGGTPAVRRSPGYPAIIATSFALFGKGSLLPIVVVQQGLIFLTTLIIAYFANLLGGIRAAFIAAFLYLTDFIVFYFANVIQTDTAFAFLLSVSVLLLYRGLSSEGRSFVWLFGAGLVLTVGTYIRPVGIYLFVPLAVAIFVLVYRRSGLVSVGAKAGALFLLPWLLFGSLWYVRNYAVFDRVEFVGQEDDLLRERTDIMIGALEGVPYFETGPHREKYLGPSPVPPTAHLTFYLRHFDLYAKVTLRSVADLFLAPSQWYFPFYFPDYPIDRKPTAEFVAKGDLTGLAMDLLNRGLGNLALLGAVLSHLLILYVGVVLGAYRLRRSPREATVFIVVVLIIGAYFVFQSGVWGGNARFRLPLSPFLAILSAYGYVSLSTYTRR